MADARCDVAVIGGGIAGLAAAHALARKGVDFLLLEASARWGGVIRTETVDGFLLEGGPDAILAQKPEGLALCRELGLGDRLVPTNREMRNVFILSRGRLHALPEGMVLAVPTRIGPFARSSLFSWPGKLRMGLDLVIPRRRDAADESIASFLRRRFGNEAVLRLGEPLLAGIHSGDPEQLSIRATFPRFVEMERRHGSLIRGFLGARPPTTDGGAPSAFYSLAGGLGELVAALVAQLPASALRLESPVDRLHRGDRSLRLILASGGSVAARVVVLALPAPRAAPLLQDVDSALSDALRRIRFVSTATVLLGCRRTDVAHPLDGYGLLVAGGEGLRTSACGFFSTKFPGRAPQGHVLLRAFLGGARDPGILDLTDEQLSGIVREEMGTLLGLRAEPVLSRVYRWPDGTPQMEVGHLERVAQIEARLRSLPGVFLTGGGLRGTGVPDCIADAGRTAAAAAEAL